MRTALIFALVLGCAAFIVFGPLAAFTGQDRFSQFGAVAYGLEVRLEHGQMEMLPYHLVLQR